MGLFGETGQERASKLHAAITAANGGFGTNQMAFIVGWVVSRGYEDPTCGGEVWGAANQLSEALTGTSKRVISESMAADYGAVLGEWWIRVGMFEHLDQNRGR